MISLSFTLGAGPRRLEPRYPEEQRAAHWPNSCQKSSTLQKISINFISSNTYIGQKLEG